MELEFILLLLDLLGMAKWVREGRAWDSGLSSSQIM